MLKIPKPSGQETSLTSAMPTPFNVPEPRTLDRLDAGTDSMILFIRVNMSRANMPFIGVPSFFNNTLATNAESADAATLSAGQIAFQLS